MLFRSTLVVGDSLVEQTDLGGACGRTYNSGIGGARIQQVQEVLPDLISATNPRRIVIVVGANHFAAGDEAAAFRRLYPQLVDSVAGYVLVLVGVSNSKTASEVVKREADRVGATYVAPIPGPLQADGLHHTVEGSRAYRAAIREGCNRAEPPQTRAQT